MISIIIPAYNAADTIVEALESVFAQTLWAKKTTDYRLQTTDLGTNETSDIRQQTTDQGEKKAMDQKAGEEDDQTPSSWSNVYSLKSNVSPVYEVIIVDDCSTDNTVEVVQEWITSHPSHFTLHVLPVNAGPAAARNRGVREAKGEWIAFLDADDIWMPHKLELQMRLASEHPEVVLWCGGSIRFQGKRMETTGVEGRTTDYGLRTTEEERGTTTKHTKGTKTQEAGQDIDMDEQDGQEGRRKRLQNTDYKQQLSCVSCSSMLDLTSLALKGEGLPLTSHLSPLTLQDLATHNPIGCSTVMVRKVVLDAVDGFDEKFRGPEDYELWMRIAALAEREEQKAEKTMNQNMDLQDRQDGEGGGEDLTTPSYAKASGGQAKCTKEEGGDGTREGEKNANMDGQDRQDSKGGREDLTTKVTKDTKGEGERGGEGQGSEETNMDGQDRQDGGEETTDHRPSCAKATADRPQTTDRTREDATGKKGIGGITEDEEQETRCNGGDTDPSPFTLHHSLPASHVSQFTPHPSPLTSHVPPDPSRLTPHVSPFTSHLSPLTHCSAPLTFHRIRLGSLSMDDRTFLPQVMRMLDKAYGPGGVLEAVQPFKKAAISNQYWGGVWMAYSRGSRWTALTLAWKAWRVQKGCGQSVKMALRYAFGWRRGISDWWREAHGRGGRGAKSQGTRI
jgi:glycosyltransferase involved in cell wall biosynthesis